MFHDFSLISFSENSSLKNVIYSSDTNYRDSKLLLDENNINNSNSNYYSNIENNFNNDITQDLSEYFDNFYGEN